MVVQAPVMLIFNDTNHSNFYSETRTCNLFPTDLNRSVFFRLYTSENTLRLSWRLRPNLALLFIISRLFLCLT